MTSSLYVVPAVAVAGEPDTFAITNLVDDQSIPPEFYGLGSYTSLTAPEPRLSRREAMQAGPVKRSRDLIAGTLGTLPLVTVRPDLTVDHGSWLAQPERDVAPSVTMTRTVEDMLFEGIAWWKITKFDWTGRFPREVVKLDPRSVDVMPDMRVHVTGEFNRGVCQEWPHDGELIRFDSPNDALLIAAATAIRQFLRLKKAGANASDGAPPVDYFSPKGDTDPFTDAQDVRDRLLDPWQTARRAGSTGYVPYGVDYAVNGWDPEKLQLSAQVSDAVVEIARHAGIDSEELGVSTTSRTYANMFERRKSFLDFTLGAYRWALQGRLTMEDVTPRGTKVRFDLDEFNSSDPLARYQAAEVGQRVGAVTPEETRAAEGKPPIPPTPEVTA